MNSAVVPTPILSFKENIQKDGIYQTTVNYTEDTSFVLRNTHPCKLLHWLWFFFPLLKNPNSMPWSYHHWALGMPLTISIWNTTNWLQNLHRKIYSLPPFFWRVQALKGSRFHSLVSVACTWQQAQASKLAVAHGYVAMCLKGKVEENPSVTQPGHAHKWLKLAKGKGCKSWSEGDWWCLWNILSGCQRGVCSWGLRIIFVEGFYH